ncbi:MAG: hypothetical protein AABX65_02845 [Nanoarchaeota archaeon]
MGIEFIGGSGLSKTDDNAQTYFSSKQRSLRGLFLQKLKVSELPFEDRDSAQT